MAITHLITGFGLDKRVLECLNLPPERFRCVDLIPVEPGESMPRYALKLAEKIGFQTGDAVGGLSLGGMLALEIAKQCDASQVTLLSSCTHPRFIRPQFRAAGRLARWTPKIALHILFQNIPVFLRLTGMHTSKGSNFVRKVMGDFPPRLIQQFPKMILDWEGCEPSVLCRALHCENDWLIRPPLHLPHLTLLPGKFHLTTVSRTEAVRNFLMDGSTSSP